MRYFLEAPIIQGIARMLPDLSDKQRRIANYILENVFQVASGSIEFLARETGVSTASINRFACTLGYPGYGAFRQELLQAFKPSVTHLENLRHEVGKGSSDFEVIQASFQGAEELVQTTRRNFSPESITRAVDLISSAKAVYCLGLGLSTLLSDMAALRFTPYCGHVHSLTRHGGQENALYGLQKIGPGDLFIALSFPRYSKETIRLTQFARSRQATILAFTDKPSSPLVSLADHFILAGSSHQTLYISLVGAIAAIEAVASALALRNPNVLEETAALTEQLLPYFYCDSPDSSDSSTPCLEPTPTEHSKTKVHTS